jgi:hydroxymethylpyrimidine pyrophosphatase-like HAD family hydrolase
MAAVLIPVAIFTVTGRTMVSPTAQVEELNVPMVVVIGAWARRPSKESPKKRIKNNPIFKIIFIKQIVA